jgi:hypothetical protein
VYVQEQQVEAVNNKQIVAAASNKQASSGGNNGGGNNSNTKLEDGYNWRKYERKQVKGSENPRSYYKCTYNSCSVKKKVERSLADGRITQIVYKGAHNHSKPLSTCRKLLHRRGGGRGGPAGPLRHSHPNRRREMRRRWRGSGSRRGGGRRRQEPGAGGGGSGEVDGEGVVEVVLPEMGPADPAAFASGSGECQACSCGSCAPPCAAASARQRRRRLENGDTTGR